jgi:protease-4
LTVRRGIGIVVVLLVAAIVISLAGLLVLYAVFAREPIVASRSTLVIRIAGDVVEGGPDDSLGQLLPGTRRPAVRTIVEGLRKAKQDSRISAVLLMPSNFQSPYWGKIQEVRDALVDFRRSGKPSFAFLEYGGEREYYLASACDKVFLLPSSPLEFDGLASYEMFLRGTLDKIGAYPDMHHIGDYKTYTNTFTEKGFTPAHREMAESLNRDAFEQLVRGVADGRRKGEAEVVRLVDQGPFLAEDAVRVGLVDDLAYEDQVLARLPGKDNASKIEIEDYARVSAPIGQRGGRMALLYTSGTIASGRSGFDPINGGVVGSETIVDAIRRIRSDDSIKAIILRIDSPGGSAVASDVIWRELLITRNGKTPKPIVASMSDLAASGGYYIAAAAQTIVAEPGTLTGSIGILGGKIVTGGTFAKLGVGIDGVVEGQNADMNSPVRPYNDQERKKLEDQLQSFYDQFVEKVARARHMTPERVDTIAQGRVWTGRQAKEIGLVDALGGLDRAVAMAKQAARISQDQGVELVVYPPRKTFLELLSSQFGTSSGDLATLRAAAALLGRETFVGAVAPLALFRRGEPLALMPVATGSR